MTAPVGKSNPSYFFDFQLDKGRLLVSDRRPINNPLFRTMQETLYKVKRIVSLVVVINSIDALDVPLLTAPPGNASITLQKTLSLLEQNSWIDACTLKEVTEIFARSTIYKCVVSEGRMQPAAGLSWQEMGAYDAQKVPFTQLPLCFANVMLYKLYRDGELNVVIKKGKDADALIKIAQSGTFLATYENLEHLEKSMWSSENLLPAGADGLNVFDEAFRTRNLPLIRALGLVFNRPVDRRIPRAMLNAILREIENPEGHQEPRRNIWSQFFKDLKQRGLTRNLEAEKQKELNSLISKLTHASITVLTLLRRALQPGGKPIDRSSSEPLWVNIAPTVKVDSSSVLPTILFALESDTQLYTTVSALIIDRALKFILAEDPSISDEMKALLPTICEQAPVSLIRRLDEPSIGELELPADEIMKELLQKANKALGSDFTEKYAKNWCAVITLQSTIEFHLDDKFIPETGKEWFEKRLKQGGVIYRFDNFLPAGYRLVILPEENIVQSRSSSSTSSMQTASTNSK